MSARWNENRKIVQRLVISGNLILLTPARFGAGDGDARTNMPILRDASDNVPLLPGASIAGALRAYLRERWLGYGITEAEKDLADDGSVISQKLFGAVLGDENTSESKRQSRESYLLIDDARATTFSTEFRPGVKINAKTRLVDFEKDKGGQLYDMELLEAGTSFPLRLELDLPADEALQSELKQGLAVALFGFELGEIGLGARKRRGFGECKVSDWKVETYNLQEPAELVAWISKVPGKPAAGKSIAEKLGFKEALPDNRARFCMEAEFKLKTSLLIRSGSGAAESPDMVHLRSKRNGKDALILSGTSLAGAMRARALRIARTVIDDEQKAKSLIAKMFGPDIQKKKSSRKVEDEPSASRIVVRERIVEGRDDLVQTRIRIDRFTGGTYPGALFEQQPIIGGKKSKVTLSVELRQPDDTQIGLLLHILKDLWTGDLPLGGEASAGRGRLEGLKADMYLHKPGQEKAQEWHILPGEKGQLQISGDANALNTYAKSIGGVQ